MRLATNQDYNDLVQLWKYCFTDSDDFRSWYFEKYYRPEEGLVISVDNRTVASLQVIDLPMRIGGKQILTGYIVGVDCLPEYRGRGFTRQLMEEAVSHYAPQHHLQLLQLMPFEADFYYPFGFVYGNYHANMILDIDEFYHPEYRSIARKYSWNDVDLEAIEENIATIEAVYLKCMQGYDGYVERGSKRRWAALLDDIHIEEGYMKLLYSPAGEAVGYLMYTFMEDKLYIREGVAKDSNARKAMYYFISTHRSQFKTVEWSAVENEPLIYRRKKDKSNVQLYPFMMFRIVDPCVMSAFASKYPQQDLCFSVVGLGKYVWRANSDLIERISESVEQEGSLSLQELTQIVFDYTAWDIVATDKKAQACVEKMKILFKEKKIIFNNEYF